LPCFLPPGQGHGSGLDRYDHYRVCRRPVDREDRAHFQKVTAYRASQIALSRHDVKFIEVQLVAEKGQLFSVLVSRNVLPTSCLSLSSVPPLKVKLHLMPKGSHSRIDRHRAGGRDGRRPRHVRNGARRLSERAGLAPWPISRVAQVDDWAGGYSPAASRMYSTSTTGRLIILFFPAPDLEAVQLEVHHLTLVQSNAHALVPVPVCSPSWSTSSIHRGDLSILPSLAIGEGASNATIRNRDQFAQTTSSDTIIGLIRLLRIQLCRLAGSERGPD
jgi:hypothetical protein